jgi:hypothetical protein
MTETSDRTEVPTRGETTSRLKAGRAVDRPFFWWSAGGIFLANAALSAGDAMWLLAFLQMLTAVWAFVAGVTATDTRRAGERARIEHGWWR